MKEQFFAFSRESEGLRRELTKCLAEDISSHCFDWQHGEFCAFLFEPSKGRLIFGRDVFGRKSLCWRIASSNITNADSIFQLSVSPGRLNKIEKSEWYEVPPGNIIIVKFQYLSAIKTDPNPNLGSDVLNLECRFRSLDEFLSQTVVIHTYYPPNHFAENPFYKMFKNTHFILATSAEDILLSTIGLAQIGTLINDTAITAFTGKFVGKFYDALEGILLHTTIKHIAENNNPSLLDVPILFSGGVDSLMVALMASDILFRSAKMHMKPYEGNIRLFSVAFGDNEQELAEASDRAQSVAAYEHLKLQSLQKYGINPYCLILINVSRRELIECRQHSIAEAVAPSATVLDDSIGCVVWFASRMRGIDFDSGDKVFDTTPFALVGSGSDEQLGGYARHRTVFESKGLSGLAEELSMEMHRIGARNFGRDDRVGMSNGKAILAPFLEEHFVCWLNTVPTVVKTGFGLPPALGAPNKFLLRNALRSLAVPEHCLQRPKRAMQFGTRMVKMEKSVENSDGKTVKKAKGTQICDRLLLRCQGAAGAGSEVCVG